MLASTKQFGATILVGIMQSSMSHKGMTGPALANPLGDILFFCQYNGLPPLTAIVVEKKTGLPFSGFPYGSRQGARDTAIGVRPSLG